jgi:hypothetical protein
MSDDGADLNMPAEGAMRAALGGPQPERLSDDEFARRIRTAVRPEPADSDSYDAAATYAARLVLEFLEQHPEHRDTPIEAEGEFQVDGRRVEATDLSPDQKWEYVKVRDGLYDVMKAAAVPLDELDLTGFMWGWAANAARNILGLEHQPNPAIVEMRTR